MIQIRDEKFESVFKVDMMANNKKYAGGVIFANNNKNALRIAKQLVKDIEQRITKIAVEEGKDLDGDLFDGEYINLLKETRK